MFGHTSHASRRSLAPGDAVSLVPPPLSPFEARVSISPPTVPPRWQTAGIIIVGG